MSEHALRPSVAGLSPRPAEHNDTGAAGMSPEDALSHALQGMARTNFLECAERSQALIACLSGEVLDLLELPAAMRGLPWELPAEAWAALQAMAKDENTAGIQTLRLAAPIGNDLAFALMARRLGVLQGLNQLVVEVNDPGAAIDLGGLPPLPQRLLVQLELHGSAPCVVALPTTGEFEVVARSPDGTQLTKSRVLRGSGMSDVQTVQDLVYFHSPRLRDRKAALTDEALLRAVGLKMNAYLAFDPEQALSFDVQDNAISCRHLALQWAVDRDAWLQAKAQPGARNAQTDFYANYRDPMSLQRHVSPAREEEFSRLFELRASSPWVKAEEFGAFLADVFTEMETGEHRHYLVMTHDHVMTVELRLKQRHSGQVAHVLNFYNPTYTATHKRTVVSSLARLELRPLADWNACALPPSRRVHAVRWSSAVVATPARTTPSPVGDALTRRLLDTMERGTTREVQGALRDIFAADPGKGDLGLSRLKGHDGRNMPALHRALRVGRLPAVAAYVHAVTTTACTWLDKDRVTVLRAIHAIDGRNPSALCTFAAGCSPECVALYARIVLAADATALTPAQKVALLEAPGDASDKDPTERMPLLARLSLQTYPNVPAQQERLRAIHLVTCEILASTRLSLPDKARLLQRPQGVRTDADLAPHKIPPACTRSPVAAMLLAILDAPLPWPHRKELIEAMAVDTASCLLPTESAASWNDNPWVIEILRRLEGLPQDDAWVGHMQSEAARLGAGWQRDTAARTPAFSGGVMLDGLGLSEGEFRAAGLRVLSPDASAAWMLCTAARRLPELEPFRVRAETRLGLPREASAHRACYLLPTSQLSPLTPRDRKATSPDASAVVGSEPVTWEAMPQGPVLLQGRGMPSAGDCLSAGLRVFGRDRHRAAHLVCTSEQPLPEAARFLMERRPPDLKSAQQRLHFYSVPTHMLRTARSSSER